jgi:two-component system cell cycle sensor histidine kinase/response regulator CckA
VTSRKKKPAGPGVGSADALDARHEATIRQLTVAVEQSPAAVLITDVRGTIEYVNPRFTRMTGYSAAEALGQNPRILQSGLTPASVYEELWSTIRAGGEWRGEIQNRRKNGELFWNAISISPIRDASGTITNFVAVQEDVTERRGSLEALRRSEEGYRDVVERSPLGIYRVAPDGRFIMVNDSLVRLLGYTSAAELLVRNLERDVYEDPTDRSTVLERVRDDTYRNVEVIWKRRDGSPITVRVNGHVLRGPDGEVECYESFVEDVTERINLEHQFRQAQKMEAVGRLAGGIAHDFNNLLTAIMGYAEMLYDDLSADDPRRADAHEIRVAADRAATLTRQLLAFSRQQVLEPRVLDLNDVVAGMDKLLRRLIGEDIELRTLLSADLWKVRVDPGQVEQVVVNLAVNSRDAMLTGGRLTIETANLELDETYTAAHQVVEPGRYVMFAVSDTGAGMSEDVKAHMFEPFFTTKEKGKGTGLGLATVYGIVKQSGGYVWAYSEVGKGTTFKVYLPRVEGSPAEPSTVVTDGAGVPGGTETILLVEDEELVRKLAREVLTRQGYRVLEAGRGDDALAVLVRETPGSVHLLLSDLVLPGMGGQDLHERVMGVRPEIKVLFMSGYTDRALQAQQVFPPGTAFLQKPFTPVALSRKVREVLDR